MDPEQVSLLARIEQFRFDAPHAEPVFRRRLARENGWSLPYARRAIDEYKRFAFLAIAAGHPCTPSDQVDQVWHLHLLHTQNYWQQFCGEVLRTPLHHTPSRGGPREALKFERWYERTLASYRLWFGEAPPGDLWPPPSQRFQTFGQRVDRDAFWLVPKVGVRALRNGLLALLSALSGLTLSGCATLHAIPPFDMRGGDFLAFFLVSWLACVGVGLALRYRARRIERSAASAASAFHPYHWAYLAGGAEALTSALLSALVERRVLVFDAARARLVAEQSPAPGAHPLDVEVERRCARESQGATIPQVRGWVRDASREIAQTLEASGLLVPDAQRKKWLSLALFVPVVGAVKIGVGVAFHKPVGLLLVLCSLAVPIAFALFGRRPVRTTMGQEELDRIRGEVASALAEQAGEAAARPAVSTALAVGLLGAGLLADTALADLGRMLLPRSREWGGGGGDGGGGGGGDGGCGGCGGCGG